MDNKAAGGYIHLYGFSLDWVDVDIRFKESLRVIRYCLYFGLGYYWSRSRPRQQYLVTANGWSLALHVYLRRNFNQKILSDYSQGGAAQQNKTRKVIIITISIPFQISKRFLIFPFYNSFFKSYFIYHIRYDLYFGSYSSLKNPSWWDVTFIFAITVSVGGLCSMCFISNTSARVQRVVET